MYNTSSSHKLNRLQTLFSWLKASVFVDPGWPKSWHIFAARFGQLNQPLKPASRMAHFSGSKEYLGKIQQLQQQLQKQKDLQTTIQRIRRVLAANDVYTATVKALMEFFQTDWILLLENSSCYWQPVNQALYPSSAEHTTALNTYLELETIATKLRQSSPISVNQQSVQQVPVDQPWGTKLPGSWLIVPIHLPHMQPLQSTDRPWGVVAIGSKDQTNIWTIDQQTQAKILVEEIAIALDHSQLYEKLKQDNYKLQALALTDSLTELANRRRFDEYFETAWQRLAREQQPLTLILCDIDYFKRYNDYYGHPMGDICLAQVSQVLTTCIRRPADLIARYGGEEFAVVLPNTDTDGGHNVAKAIQQKLANAAIPHSTSTVAKVITLTMGVATVIPNHKLNSQDLLRAADLALYHAKQQGRDRIYVHAHYCLHNDEYSNGDHNNDTHSNNQPLSLRDPEVSTAKD